MSDLARGPSRLFERDFLAWTALRHLLTADLLREVAAATAMALAGVTLSDLFEEKLSAPGALGIWSLTPRRVEGEVARFLQQHIRALVWANDADIAPRAFMDHPTATENVLAIAVADTVRLGGLDFESEAKVFRSIRVPEDSSAMVLAQALAFSVEHLSDFAQGHLDELLETLRPCEAMLQTAALKHVGDLCADIDAWTAAQQLYLAAEKQRQQSDDNLWSGFKATFGDLILQSLAAADRVLEGYEMASARLQAALLQTTAPDQLLTLNGSHDAMVAALLADLRSAGPDLRAAAMLPPLLLSSLSLDPAVRHWRLGNYSEAYRFFWSVLRRQTALGSASESRETKALFAQAVLDEVEDESLRRDRRGELAFAVRLLIESGDSKTARRISFSPLLVRLIDQPLIEEVARRAERHAGARVERLMVVFELFAKWLKSLPAGREALAERMLNVIISQAGGHPATFETTKNLGGRGLEVLKNVAEARPEFCALVPNAVADLVLAKLSEEGFWTGVKSALGLAEAYLGAWSAETLQVVLHAMIALLDRRDPTEDSWIVQPSMGILMSEPVIALARTDKVLGAQVFGSILRFGLGHMSESVRLLLNLSRFEGDLELTDQDRRLLDEVIGKAQARLEQSDLMNAGDFAMALLAAASHAGPEVITSVLEAISKTLGSAGAARPWASFPYAYMQVLYLARHRREIEHGAGLSPEAFQAHLDQLGAQLLATWEIVMQKPQLLARFAIPPQTDPDPTLIHNWSVATREFAEHVAAGDGLRAVLTRAEGLAPFAQPIGRARSKWLGSKQEALPDIGEIESESDEFFYEALGSRLASLAAAPEAQRIPIVEALLRRCLALGPRYEDAALFAMALTCELVVSASATEVEHYLGRLDSKADLNGLLAPLVYALQGKGALPRLGPATTDQF